MTKRSLLSTRPVIASLAFGLMLALLMAIWRMAIGNSFSWPVTIASALGFAVILVINRLSRGKTARLRGGARSLLAVALSIVILVFVIVYFVTDWAWLAGLLLTLWFLLFLQIELILSSRRVPVLQWVIRLAVAIPAAVIPVAVVQILSGFAEEEFFVALQAAILALCWVCLSVASQLLGRFEPNRQPDEAAAKARYVAGALIALCLVILVGSVRAYQSSFYPTTAPSFKGVSEESPFLCAELPQVPSTDTAGGIFRRLLARVADNPEKGPPEYGMLALGTGEPRWAQLFRTALLAEAAGKSFATAAGSMKSVQYEAALRAYYYPRVKAKFPELFSPADETVLKGWFAAINRRALTTEPVDWLYALAFAKVPEGPYENQEIGSGLLTLLEGEQLSDPLASPANRAYLDRMPRGWDARFRNTDDAYGYQIVWQQNAYFQSLYSGQALSANVRLSFDWLISQALPDGAPLRYNHPDFFSLAGAAYAGAAWLRNPAYLWLAAQAVAEAERTGRPVYAQPGAEQPVVLSGVTPKYGSCLLFGGSGLPNQSGPLAPDKIVFRDGWTANASYLLLNLRFTGWHRYKATNTITSVYQAGELSGDTLTGQVFSWLPKGRSLFRDKRIPRENLNGLLVPRAGLDAILQALTGVGSRWAQDPPHYAEVLAFEPGVESDRSLTRLSSWHGWTQDRTIYFYHNGGPIIVADEVEGPDDGEAQLAWQMAAPGKLRDGRLTLRNGNDPAEAVFLQPSPSDESLLAQPLEGGRQAVSYNIEHGIGRIVTVFLTGRWTGAEVVLEDRGKVLRITQDGRQVTQSLSWQTTAP